MVRDVEKPSAPGFYGFAHDHGHGRDLVGVGRFVGGAALAHRIRAHRPVRHLHTDVDGERAAVERVEVFGERLPGPVHPLAQRGTGDVFDALHQTDEPLLRTRAHRRESDAAVPGDDGGDAVSRRRLEDRVPCGLTVVVRVHVDEPWSDEHAGRVDRLGGFAVERPVRHGDDDAVLRRDVAVEASGSGAVDDRAAGDLQVVHTSTSQTKSSSMFARFRPNTKAFGISSISEPGASWSEPTLRTSSSKNTRISSRANAAPRQKWVPKPKAMC